MKRTTRKADREFAERLAAKYDALTLDCLVRIQYASAEAIAALHDLADSGQSVDAISDYCEKILHTGFREAVGILPPMPIARRDFDALPVLPEKYDPSFVGLGRKALRSWWVLVRANPNGTAVFYRPDVTDGKSLLH